MRIYGSPSYDIIGRKFSILDFGEFDRLKMLKYHSKLHLRYIGGNTGTPGNVSQYYHCIPLNSGNTGNYPSRGLAEIFSSVLCKQWGLFHLFGY